MNNNNKNDLEGRQYFIFEERTSNTTGLKWVYLKDLSGVIWGLFSSYKRAKNAIPILVYKYRKVFEQRTPK